MQTPRQSRRVRFVLCEPSHPGNIGSAARAIKTMGFRDLRVVAPREAGFRTHEEAIAFATSSVDVLEACRTHATLAEALEGVTFAWAFTGKAVTHHKSMIHPYLMRTVSEIMPCKHTEK